MRSAFSKIAKVRDGVETDLAIAPAFMNKQEKTGQPGQKTGKEQDASPVPYLFPG
jgi:hypothetical protein